MITQEQLCRHRNGIIILDGTIRRIESLIGALRRVGSETIAAELEDHIEEIDLAKSMLAETFDALHADCVQGIAQASDNMLRAALAGVTMATREAKP